MAYQRDPLVLASPDVLTGAGAATPIALAAISTDDTIVAAFLAKDPAATGAALAPLTPSIPSNGNVQFVEATNASANDRVLVIWFDKQAL